MNAYDRPPGSAWKLQDAKARLSELVRRAETEGPQHVTVHGRDAAVVLSAADYERLAMPKGRSQGVRLIEAMRDCPVPEFAIETDRSAEVGEDRDMSM